MSHSACPLCAGKVQLRTAVGDYPLFACAGCGLEFLDPQPDDAALGEIYGQHYYDAWGVERNEAAVRSLKMASFRRRLESIRHLLPKGARVLDVGCATGYFLEVASEFGLDPFGVELSAYGAEVCRKKVGAGHVYQGELEGAAFADFPAAQFDVIFMSDLIEHVRDPGRTLQAARERLRRGGLLLITTPWTASLSRRLGGRHWLHYKPEHLYYFGPDNLDRLLRGTGFSILRCTPADKCLSLRYAATQLAVGGVMMRAAARLLNRLPARLLDRQLWVRIGESTVLAQC